MLERVDTAERFRGKLVRDGRGGVAQHGGGAISADGCGESLPGGDSFEADTAERAVLLFHDNQHSAHRTRTSERSFSTSCEAISAGLPLSIWVCFCFSGRNTRVSSAVCGAAGVAASTVRVSLVLAFLMPISVA